MNRTNSKRLKALILEYQKKKHPNVPDHCLVVEVAPDTNEKGIKKNLKAFCKAVGIKCSITDSAAKASVKMERMNHASGRSFNKVSVNYRRSEFEKGHHDVELSKNNRLWSVEIKAQNKRTKYKDKQSDVQKEFERKLKDQYGNDYYIVRGMDDIFDLYDNEIAPNL